MRDCSLRIFRNSCLTTAACLPRNAKVAVGNSLWIYLLVIFAAFTITLFPAAAAPVTLDFSSDLEGFTDNGSAGGALTYSTGIGAGSLHLTNPAGWHWRAAVNVNGNSTGTLGSFTQALQRAGAYGGTLSFDLVLTPTAVTGNSGGFGGVSYLVAVSQDSANGGGWDQLVATNLSAAAFPIPIQITIPIQIVLVPCTNTPVNGNDSVLSLRSDSSWYQIQLGTSAYGVSTVEWYVDNMTVTPNPTPPPPGGVISLEAENGTLTGNTYVSTTAPGYSGTGYVTGFQTSSDTVNWTFTGTTGLDDLVVTFRSPYGQKGFNGSINGHGFSGMFPQTTTFTAFDAGLVEVVPGTNTLQIGGGWNYYDIDRVVLTPVPTPAPPLPVPATLTDPQATFATRALMAQLVADYGKHTYSGQYDPNDVNFIMSVSGRRPAIFGSDFMDYSPSRVAFGSMPANLTESDIALEHYGVIITMCWHWNAPTNLLNTTNAPWWSGFYTYATTFDVAAALADTNSVEYGLILRDIDAIAVQLQKFSDANVPVLWRPLHEAEGGWFWWGAKGPDAFKALWRLLYNRLTVNHNLHNLIWVLSSTDPNWYPGNDVVDIVGLDAYPSDPSDALSPDWLALKSRFDGVKLLALTEFGGVPDIERMQHFGVWWSYFASWGGTVQGVPAATVTRIYQSPEVITVDELNAVPPQITGGAPLSSGAFQLSGTGPRGSTYHVLTSTNLAQLPANWSVLTNGTFSGGVFNLNDNQASGYPQRFYRIVTP
jgi:mannan endo-1,4-beta-mannosidase